MSTYRALSGLIGVSLLALVGQGTVQAQEISTGEIPATGIELIELDGAATTLPNEDLQITADTSAQPLTDAASLDFDAAAEPAELAQARRRTRGRVGSTNFVGIGGDLGYADDLSFAVISKFGLTNKISIRPSALIGDEFSILVPVTYDFRQASGDGFQIVPYAGIGGAYNSGDDDEFQFIVSGGADFPLSRTITLNAQANLSVFDDSDFGVTVGVGYNFGNSSF